MFTGIVECMGTILSARRSGSTVHLTIKPDITDFIVPIGGSVAVDGACLTVEAYSGSVLNFSAVKGTIECTTLNSVISGRRINLERALKFGDRLDGHLVLGHVDGIGTIISDVDVGGSIIRTIQIPPDLDQFMAEKGSVTIDGISLTISKSRTCEVTVSLIPLTLQNSSMSVKKRGDLVNVECDVLARYLKRICDVEKNDGKIKDNADNAFRKTLEGSGF